MSLPVPANKTCDIYRMGNAPPAAPDVAGVACVLKPDWVAGQEHGERGTPALTWTHLLLIETSVDIRDRYTGASSAGLAGDMVYVPDQNGTPFLVIFIELINEGLPGAHKRVYLDRQAPTWPTNDL